MSRIGYRNPRFYQARTMPRLDSPTPQREALEAEGKQAGQAGKQAEALMPLVPSEGSIAKNALLSRVSELGIGVGKARGFLANLIDKGTLFEWHIPRPGTNPEVRIARHEQPQGDL